LVPPGSLGLDRPLWTQDSKQLVYAVGYGVHVVNVRTGESHDANPGELRQIGWSPLGLVSPDHRWIARFSSYCPQFCSVAGLSLLRASDESERASFPGVFAAAWSPNGKWLGLEEARGPVLPFPINQATIRRVDGATCPCPALASTPGPLYPADVNAGRIVAYGDNETLVLDRNGNRLVSLPMSPQAAQLSANDVVLLSRGDLRDYDAHSAELIHAWPLPDVLSGPVCGWRTCDQTRLVLDDAAQGLVTYTLDGDIHLLRLADSADALVGPGSLARFMDLGLVYADGARIHLVPYARLPLLSFKAERP
jgi:hypothetical protein